MIVFQRPGLSEWAYALRNPSPAIPGVRQPAAFTEREADPAPQGVNPAPDDGHGLSRGKVRNAGTYSEVGCMTHTLREGEPTGAAVEDGWA